MLANSSEGVCDRRGVVGAGPVCHTGGLLMGIRRFAAMCQSKHHNKSDGSNYVVSSMVVISIRSLIAPRAPKIKL